MLDRVFVQGFTLRQLASRQAGIPLPTVRARFRQTLARFVAQPGAPPIPRGPLVLLVDGLWFTFHEQPWVLYLMALKACRGDVAVFLAPVLVPGKEGLAGWHHALATVPAGPAQRIQALVADNLPGMRCLAHQHGWILQLCHFHLLLKLHGRYRGGRHALRGGPVRQEIAQLIRRALTAPDGPRVRHALTRLRQLAHTDCGTARIQMTVREFLRDVRSYRSYLAHPALGLPRTTNTVESMGRLLRELLRRSRAASNPQSLLRWATAFIRLRPRITCNGHQ